VNDEQTAAGIPVMPGRLPLHVERLYAFYSFEPLDMHGAYCYDTVDEWRQLTDHITDRAEPAIRALTDTPLSLFEWDILSKMQVCWRDKGLGSLAQPEALLVRDEDQAGALRPYLARLGAEYAAAVQDMGSNELERIYWDNSRIPINRGKGAPYWLPGTDRVAATAFARLADSARDYEHLQEIVRDAGGAVLGFAATAYMRIQGSKKTHDEYGLAGDELHVIGTRRGPKLRKITALPFVLNYLAAGVGAVMRELLKRRTDMNTGTIHPAAKAVRNYKYTIAVDLANYDDSVSIETLDAYREYVYKAVLDALVRLSVLSSRRRAMLLDIDFALQRLPLLAPPMRTGEAARLVPTLGGIKSGERLTSQKGTDINRERIAEKLRHLGIKAKHFNQGDDTVIASDDARLLKYTDEPTRLGFTETRSEDVSFLKRLPDGYAYLSRMLNGTINRESRFESDNIHSCASGIKIRDGLLAGHPLRRDYLRILLDAPGRVRDAARLATTADVYDLLLAGAARTRWSADKQADMINLMASAMDRGLLTAAQSAALTEQVEGLGGRAIVSLREMDKLTAEMPLVTARDYISDASYTRRRHT